MADGIGRIGGGNYGYTGFGFLRQGEETSHSQETEPVGNSFEDTQVDPTKVMEFLANNNFFVNLSEVPKAGELDAETRGRIAGYMENFEIIYGIIVEEFGEKLAPQVMDFCMDYLMGIAA